MLPLAAPNVRGPQTSDDVQIDHVVALSDAWQTCAQQLSEEHRRDLANDPLNLRAVDGPTDQDRAMPMPRAGCRRARTTAAPK
ncbi:HNH endonuclease family protein [Nocardia sp. NPDC049707]|uniref:HNH endonuclease family protein n=1 Tax=Nocardia sp. NPDC049707 TaxID=3154735 RepID=UPI00341A3834